MKLRILCVDDSKSVHAFLKDCVSSVSTDFKSVFDGEEALNHLSDKSNSYDVIFLDWEMPKKSGPDVLVEIKSKGISTPVIMLTSKSEVFDIQHGLSRGASEYIMKPFTRDIILDKLKSILNMEI